MRLYLDEDSASSLLARLLRNAGHDVQLPADVGMDGESDVVQLTQALGDGRAILTKNYDDFEDLHNLILEAQGHHLGVLAVRQDNDPKRDLTPPGIVRAIRNLVAAGVPIADQYIILNHWR
jgi:hypothetical protein